MSLIIYIVTKQGNIFKPYAESEQAFSVPCPHLTKLHFSISYDKTGHFRHL